MKLFSFQTVLNYILIIAVIILFTMQFSNKGVKYKIKGLRGHNIGGSIYKDTVGEAIVYENWVEIVNPNGLDMVIPRDEVEVLMIAK